MKIVSILTSLLLVSFALPAQASPLLFNSCSPNLSMNQNSLLILASTQVGFAGLSCQDLRSVLNEGKLIGVSLLAAKVALKSPAAREMVEAGLAAYGINLASEAVLALNVYSAIGITVVYFAVSMSLDECEKQDRAELKQNIIDELKRSYPKLTDSGSRLQIQKGQ